MIGQLEGLCTQFPFQCALVLTGVLFGYTEVTSTYSGKHCGHWSTVGVASVSSGSITELVSIFPSGSC